MTIESELKSAISEGALSFKGDYDKDAAIAAINSLKQELEEELCDEIRCAIHNLSAAHTQRNAQYERIVERTMPLLDDQIESQDGMIDIERALFLKRAGAQMDAIEDGHTKAECFGYLAALYKADPKLDALKAEIKKHLLMKLHSNGFDAKAFQALWDLGFAEQAKQVSREAIWLSQAFSFEDMLANGRKYVGLVPRELQVELLWAGLFELLNASKDLFKLDNAFLCRYQQSSQFVGEYAELFDPILNVSSHQAYLAYEDKWPLHGYFALRKISFHEELEKLEPNIITKDAAWESATNLVKQLWTDIGFVPALIGSVYGLVIAAFDRFIQAIEASSAVKRKLSRATQTLALFESLALDRHQEPAFREMHKKIDARIREFCSDLPLCVKKAVAEEAALLFSSFKLSDVPMTISERITDVFAKLSEVPKELLSDLDIDSLLDAYEQNAANRLVNCKRAFDNLQRLKADVDASVDPKMFAVRLEAEVAFINKFLATHFPSYSRRLQLAKI